MLDLQTGITICVFFFVVGLAGYRLGIEFEREQCLRHWCGCLLVVALVVAATAMCVDVVETRFIEYRPLK